MAQTPNTKESTLRQKLKGSGKKLSSVIWGWVDVIEHDLTYLLTEKDIGMDELIAEVEDLLNKDDIETLANRLQEYSRDVHFKWQTRASRVLVVANHIMQEQKPKGGLLSYFAKNMMNRQIVTFRTVKTFAPGTVFPCLVFSLIKIPGLDGGTLLITPKRLCYKQCLKAHD